MYWLIVLTGKGNWKEHGGDIFFPKYFVDCQEKIAVCASQSAYYSNFKALNGLESRCHEKQKAYVKTSFI